MSSPSCCPLPGRTPAEAVKAFLQPLQDALACVANAKISVSPGGYGAGREHSWTPNRGDGVALDGGFHLDARMKYRIVEQAHASAAERWRVTTLAYTYRLLDQAGELWVIHWHPDGPSPDRAPHLHLGTSLLAPSGIVTRKSHIPTGRITFERVIRFAIECGAEPKHADWDQRLLLAEGPHLLYRSWSGDPTLELPPEGTA